MAYKHEDYAYVICYFQMSTLKLSDTEILALGRLRFTLHKVGQEKLCVLFQFQTTAFHLAAN